MKTLVATFLCVGCQAGDGTRTVAVEPNDLGITRLEIDRGLTEGDRVLTLRGFGEAGGEIASSTLRTGMVWYAGDGAGGLSAGTELSLQVGDAVSRFVTPDREAHEQRIPHGVLSSFATLRAVTAEVNATLDTELTGELVYCSRSGPPSQPWLEPDVNDLLEELAHEGADVVVLVPIGFVSDHMEVVYDLDTEAAATAERLGLRLVRVPTVGTDPQFVSGLVDLIEERAAQARGEDPTCPARPTVDGPLPSVCPPGCCPNLRVAKPALCGSD